MAAAITLTLRAAIMYGSGHHPIDGSGQYLWQQMMRLATASTLYNAPCFGTISWKERTLNDGRCDSPKARTPTMEAAIIYGSGHYPNDGSDNYLWRRPLP